MQVQQLRVRDVMSTSPVSIPHDLTLEDAAQRMFEHGIRHLPVLEGGHVVGLVSARDIAMLDSIPNVDRAKVSIEQAMTQGAHICAPDEPLVDLIKVMVDQKKGSAVVMEGGKLVGIVTTIDALALLMNYLG
ncbi:MAG: CBS domain-containing protein [Nannocystaceae bacterium]